MQLKIRIIFLVISLLILCDAETEKQEQRNLIGESQVRICDGPVGVASRKSLTNLTQSEEDLFNYTSIKYKCRKYTKRRYRKIHHKPNITLNDKPNIPLNDKPNIPLNLSSPSIAIALQYMTLVINTNNSNNNIELIKVLNEFLKHVKANRTDVGKTLELHNKDATWPVLEKITGLGVFRIDNENSTLHAADMKIKNKTIEGAFPNSNTTLDLNKNDPLLQIAHTLISTTEAALKDNDNNTKLLSTISDLKNNVSLHSKYEAPLKENSTLISLRQIVVNTEFEELQSIGVDLIERTTFGIQNAKQYDHSTATNCVEVPTDRSGIYTLRSKVRNFEPFKAYCNMKFRGGGWTVIQRRIDGSINFDRDWQTYKNGFGQLLGEFWLGLEKIYQLTALTPHELVITMKDFKGKRRFARYDFFMIGDEMQGYELYSLKRFHGTGRDSLIHNLGNKFSTSSAQIKRPNCVTQDYGGWWYGKCSQNNLNSLYDNKSKESLKFVEMMIRPSEYKFRG